MPVSERTRCTAILLDTAANRSAALLELRDGDRGVVRQAGVLYSVSPTVPNAAKVLTVGLSNSVIAWKTSVDR